ncbi:MAG: serine--tRNA ligase [Planctomycetes bacterium]|nr:serine--tRNA ligase [Planctomycetota bacterium]
MIDIRLIRDQPDLVKDAARKKGMKVDIDQVLAVDARRRALETEFNELRSRQNAAGEKMAKASKEQREAIKAEMTPIKARLAEIDAEKQQVDESLRQLMLLVPQIPDAAAPIGASDAENVEVRRVGTPRRKDEFGFPFKDHVELGTRLGIIDMDRGVKLAGSRNYVLKGAGAMLHEAVLRLAWDMMIERGFVPMTVPVLVLDKLMEGTGYFPLGRDQAYLCERDGQSLVGTAEVPVTGYHMDEILREDELPKLYCARSTCFRREAGAGGKDTYGLYRIHLFDKIEQVVICKAEAAESARWHQAIIKNATDLLDALELPYRLLEVCTGDMGQGKVRMFDIETWMPSRNAYGETHSASSFHDFQSRRLNLKYRDAGGKIHVCHTLNNTVVASPRILIPLLELNQQADGSIRIPESLRAYMGNRCDIR